MMFNVKDVNANTLFNSFFWWAANLFLRIHSYLFGPCYLGSIFSADDITRIKSGNPI